MAKLVFCEDDPTIQKLVRVALRATPHQLYIATDGAEGLALIERERPDMIFTDVAMPIMDGFQLLDMLKARPALARIPVIFMTASVQRHQMEEGYRQSVADYLTKPFTVAELRAKIDEYVSKNPKITAAQ